MSGAGVAAGPAHIAISSDPSPVDVMELGENLTNVIFIVGTGIVAWHGLTFRTKDGEREWVHLLFGCIALMYCLWVIFSDVLGLF